MFDVSMSEILLVLIVMLVCGRKEEAHDIITIYKSIIRQIRAFKNSIGFLLEDITSEIEIKESNKKD